MTRDKRWDFKEGGTQTRPSATARSSYVSSALSSIGLPAASVRRVLAQGCTVTRSFATLSARDSGGEHNGSSVKWSGDSWQCLGPLANVTLTMLEWRKEHDI